MPPTDGTAMDVRLSSKDMVWLSDVTGKSARGTTTQHFGAKAALLAAIMIAAVAGGMYLPSYIDSVPKNKPARAVRSVGVTTPRLAQPAAVAPPARTSIPDIAQPAADRSRDESEGLAAIAPVATSPTAAAPVDGLKISRQSVRRGGLGSKALVTLSIRNTNDYAVKDIDVLCAFTSRDGNYVTERHHVIGGAMRKKSRRTFPRMLVGFVSIGASRAKCSLVAANRVEPAAPDAAADAPGGSEL